jgi:hypothetical protein
MKEGQLSATAVTVLHFGQVPGPDDGRPGGIGIGGFVAEDLDHDAP